MKQYLLTNKTEPIYRKMYDQSLEDMKKYLLKSSFKSKLMFVGELEGQNFIPRFEHLTCIILMMKIYFNSF